MKPTTRFRLTARIAQIAKTVAMVIAKPTPCQSMNATAQVSTIRFAQSSTLPRARRRRARGSRAEAASVLIACEFMAIGYFLGRRPLGQNERKRISTPNETTSLHSPARSQMPNCSTMPRANPPTMAP